MGKLINLFSEHPIIRNESEMNETEIVDKFVWYLRGRNRPQKFYEKVARDIAKKGLSILVEDFDVSLKKLHPYTSTFENLEWDSFDIEDFEEKLEDEFNLWLDYNNDCYTEQSSIGEIFYTLCNAYTSHDVIK